MLTNLIERNGENVTDFFIGEFNDKRLRATGALLFKRLYEKMSTCIKNIAETRKLEVSFGRFLRNRNTTVKEMTQEFFKKTNQACLGKNHVLAIGDTVENSYPNHKIKKNKFGKVSDNETQGFLAHPVVVVDAENKEMLGISSLKTWCRKEKILKKRCYRPIEQKESFKWIEAMEATEENITHAKKITMVFDREGDIYELFDRIPNERIELLVRLKYDRKSEGDGCTISEILDKTIGCMQHEIELPPITGKRKARTALMEIKFSKVIIQKPRGVKNCNYNSITLTCVEAFEISTPPAGEEKVHWRILTTHDVRKAQEALQIIVWYTWRWTIEQTFRALKSKGLNIENSQIEEPSVLEKLFALSLIAAVKTMALVHARDGLSKRPASDFFTLKELIVLALLLPKFEGATEKQKNPFIVNSLSWVSWIIARLGGWDGYRYRTASPPGPITMHRGLVRFESYIDAFLLFQQKDLCIG